MTYFNYHAKIERKIKEGKLKKYYFVNNYKNIGFALVLNFDNAEFPIREHKFEHYFNLIGLYYNTEINGDVYFTKFK